MNHSKFIFLEKGSEKHNIMSKKYFSSLLIILALFACTSEQKARLGSDDSILPEGSGEYGEVVIVVNRDKWDGELGIALKEVFHSSVPGLTRGEPFFTTRIIEPFQFNKIFKHAKNLVYVTSFQGSQPADRWLQNTFTEESKKMVFEDPDQFMRTQDDQYARRQKVLHLFGKDDATLMKNLRANKEVIRNYFNIAEKERLAKDIRTSTAGKKIAERIKNKFGYDVKIPAGYELAVLEDDFTWVRFLPSVGPSKNLVVYFKPYESQDEFKHENIIKLRNEIGKSYIFGDPKNPESFMTTEERYVPIQQRDINFDGRYTVETKGAWKTNNLTVGGTFVSYTFVDEATSRLYYIEGFVIHPNEEHRELIREMESLLTTFRPGNSRSTASVF